MSEHPNQAQHTEDNNLRGRRVFDTKAGGSRSDGASAGNEPGENEQQAFKRAAQFSSQSLQLQELDELMAQESVEPLSDSGLSGTKRLSGLSKLLLVALGLLLGVETLRTLQQAWLESPWLFGLYGAVTGLAAAWIGRGMWREYRLLARLKRSAQQREAAERLSQSMQQGEATVFIESVCKHLPDTNNLQRFYQSRREDQNDAEQLLLFDDLVLSPLDLKARAIVRKYAGESALLLAASPLAVLDMALIMWRNQKMIRELAGCYGIELGYWSRVKLLRGIIHNILYAGASEVAVDLGSQLLSMEVTGKLSARLAQGLGGGLLTARLGYQAMALCRPIAFADGNRPKLGQLHKELLVELKGFSAQVLKGETQKETVSRNK